VLQAIKQSPPKLQAQIEEDTLWLYHDVGEPETTEAIVKWIAGKPKNSRLWVRINSYGGLAYDGLAIYNALREHGNVVTRIDGIAASAAGIIALAGKPMQMVRGSALFLHLPYAAVIGNSRTLREIADSLAKMDRDIAQIVASKARMSEDEAMRLLVGKVDGSWLGADDAQQLRLADVILETEAEDEKREEPAVTPTNKTRFKPLAFVPSDPPGGEGEGIEGEWQKPTLEDFTDKGWDELEEDERREIASYFGFAVSLDSFGDLKLPHHFPPSDSRTPKASLAAVRNALASLSQTEGISEEDAARVEAHLRAHMPEETEDSARGREAMREQILRSLHEKLVRKGQKNDNRNPQFNHRRNR